MIKPINILILLLIVSIGQTLYDRYAGNGTAWTFYAPDIDMTCVVGKDEGQKSMFCLPGDHREGAEQ